MKNLKSLYCYGKQLFLSLFLNALFVCVFIPGQVAQAQENFVPGEVVVHLTPGVIDFPVGSDRKPITEVTIRNPQARAVLAEIATSKIGRVFRFAVPHDTLKTNRLGEVVRVADASQFYKLKISGDALAAVEKLQSLPFVLFAEPNYIGTEESGLPNDFHFVQGNQWGLHNTGQFGYTADVDVDAPEAWDVTTGSSSVLVAILDSGIDYNHPDLGSDFGAYPNQKIAAGYNFFDDNSDPLDLRSSSHGTAVSGIIGALTNNDDGSNNHKVAGIGGGWANSPFGFQLLPVKVTDPSNGTFTYVDLANGILWAAQTKGAEVLNISLGKDSESSVLRFAITEAYNAGAVTVASMGNDNSSNPIWPGGYDNSLISVGAIDFRGRRVVPGGGITWGSNTGSWLDVMAPGLNHWTTARLASGGYKAFGGTSAAAPFVSGFAGLILSVDASASFEKVEAIIRASGTTYPTWNSSEGYGYIKMRKGLDLLSDPNATEYNWTASGGSGTFDNARFYLGGYNYDRYKVTKNVSFSQNFTAVPVVWGRRSGSTGSVRWPASTSQLYYDYTGVEPGTESTTGCQLVTFVYKKFTITGQFLGWVPTSPSNVTFAYTALGVPPGPLSVIISGPSALGWKERGTWTANPSGGSGSYAYEWRKRYNGTGSWSGVEGTSQQYSRTMLDTDFEIQVKVTSGGQSVYDTHYVYYGLLKQGVSDNAEAAAQIPEQFSLKQNYPNPFNPTTEIKLALPENGHVTLSIFNVVGQKIRTLIDRQKEAGYHSVIWDGKDEFGNEVASGIYVYRIYVHPDKADGKPFESFKKMTLLR